MAERIRSYRAENIREDIDITFMIQQEGSNRFLDAYEGSGHAYGVVTRPSQNNNSQRWRIRRAESVANEEDREGESVVHWGSSGHDYGIVSHPLRISPDPQRQIEFEYEADEEDVVKSGGAAPVIPDWSAAAAATAATTDATADEEDEGVDKEIFFTIQQEVNHRYLHAHESESSDYTVVTRASPFRDLSQWIITPAEESPDLVTIQQKSSGLYLAASEDPDQDFAVLARQRRYNSSERWTIRYQTNYEVTLKTADILGAGTDAAVYITFIGDTTSDKFELVSQRNLREEWEDDKENYLEKGAEETFDIFTLDDYGDLRKIEIRLGDGRGNDDWDLDEVMVRNAHTGQQWVFPCDENDPISPCETRTLNRSA